MGFLQSWLEFENLHQGVSARPSSDNAPAAGVDIDTDKIPRVFTEHCIYQGVPDQAAIDLADQMLEFIAHQDHPVLETAIIRVARADDTLARSILYRLCVDGIVEPVAGSRFRIPPWPPEKNTLPKGCPLRGAGPHQAGCRFHSQLLVRVVAAGILPLPGVRCSLRAICKMEAA